VSAVVGARTGYRQAQALMGTVVSIEGPAGGDEVGAACERAFGWFAHVERACSRFEADSEVVQLTRTVGKPVMVSAVLFEAVRFGTALACQTAGAFDVAVGALMERRGFDRSYRTGRRRRFGNGSQGATYRDLVLDERARTITLTRPVVIDLGAVAKGLAIDLAARELAPLGDYAIDAGGDVYVQGRNLGGRVWRVGIQHPRKPGETIECLEVSNAAVCTSGDYEQRASTGGGHHIVDPRTGSSPTELASLTVVAPSAMLADGLATAAFVLGAARGLRLIERSGAEGMAITRGLERRVTSGYQALVAGAPA